MQEKLLILDFGSQYTQLIARRVRELNVFCEIRPHTMSAAEMRSFMAGGGRGVILSGGPASVMEAGAPGVDPNVFDLGVPVLGICYGQQLMVQMLGGSIRRSGAREYGSATVTVLESVGPLKSIPGGVEFDAWMSHGDSVDFLPPGFRTTARSSRDPFTAIADPHRKLYGFQFHPEVAHTPDGRIMLRSFLDECDCSFDWTPGSFIEESVEQIRRTTGGAGVVLGLSGGVDSMVAAALIHRAIGDKLRCIFVDNGLLREGEVENVQRRFRDAFGRELETVDASGLFLHELAGVTDPEQKRKIIGRVFVTVFESAVHAGAYDHGRPRFLAQGTLYPDVIESTSVRGPSAVIKSHHNVGGLPETLGLELLEPLRELFKDEVRAVGRQLGLSDDILLRQPFPGPGLAVRIVGSVTSERIAVVRKADAIVRQEIDADRQYDPTDTYENCWQAFAALLPVRTVGVMGDERTYDEMCVVRVVNSDDGMTADVTHVPHETLDRIASRIVNEVKGVNRVVFDITSKPPGTIEFE